ncbi:hypothetical protein [Loigolactobacillus jiayinensis]|uniref:Uncharacterized protein n=1 Tax=Loigolactobacillus jiayinensis TaxID=2486016 RepID=A0ABW1RBN5_9LACO|nr:hypothetical protein [Loigolactobacillus jiayinensis]
MKAKGLAKAKYWIIGGVLLVIVVLLGLSRTTLPHLGFINVRGVYIEHDNSFGKERTITVVYRNGQYASDIYGETPGGVIDEDSEWGHYEKRGNKLYRYVEKGLQGTYYNGVGYYSDIPMSWRGIDKGRSYQVTAKGLKTYYGGKAGTSLADKSDKWVYSYEEIKKGYSDDDDYQRVTPRKFDKHRNGWGNN